MFYRCIAAASSAIERSDAPGFLRAVADYSTFETEYTQYTGDFSLLDKLDATEFVTRLLGRAKRADATEVLDALRQRKQQSRDAELTWIKAVA